MGNLEFNFYQKVVNSENLTVSERFVRLFYICWYHLLFAECCVVKTEVKNRKFIELKNVIFDFDTDACVAPKHIDLFSCKKLFTKIFQLNSDRPKCQHKNQITYRLENFIGVIMSRSILGIIVLLNLLGRCDNPKSTKINRTNETLNNNAASIERPKDNKQISGLNVLDGSLHPGLSSATTETKSTSSSECAKNLTEWKYEFTLLMNTEHEICTSGHPGQLQCGTYQQEINDLKDLINQCLAGQNHTTLPGVSTSTAGSGSTSATKHTCDPAWIKLPDGSFSDGCGGFRPAANSPGTSTDGSSSGGVTSSSANTTGSESTGSESSGGISSTSFGVKAPPLSSTGGTGQDPVNSSTSSTNSTGGISSTNGDTGGTTSTTTIGFDPYPTGVHCAGNLHYIYSQRLTKYYIAEVNVLRLCPKDEHCLKLPDESIASCPVTQKCKEAIVACRGQYQ